MSASSLAVPSLVAALAPQIGLSFALAAPILGLRRLALRRLPESGGQAARAGRVRLVSNLCLAAALGFVWIAELQSLLLSVTAVLMALVIATKELIQCATGWAMRAAGRSFRVGDQVSLDGVCGRVAAHSLLTTTIEETDARSFGSRPTGRRLVVPNSRLFSAGVHVEDRTASARRHAISITLDIASALREVLQSAEAAAARHAAGDAPAPCVALATTELGKARIDIVLFCRPDAVAAAERAITLEVIEAAAGRAPAPARRPVLSLVESAAA